MRSARALRALTVALCVALVAGAFVAGPAQAGKKKKKFSCAPATAAAPTEGHSANAEEAAEAEVVNVTAAHTEEAPLVIEYEHGPALSDAMIEDTLYFAFQVVSKTPGFGVYIRQEWPGSMSDMDLYMYDSGGAEVSYSGAYNPAPIPGVTDSGGNGGQGYESIPGFPADPCSPYTLESKAYMTMGEPMTLKIWLGEAGDTYNTP